MVYFLPTDSPWLLSVLNSPLLWSFCWREAVHGKDEALRFFTEFVERIPIAPASEEMLGEVGPAVERLRALTRKEQQAQWALLDWLRTEFGVEAPGQRLQQFASLDADVFVDEVRKRRPKTAGRLSPATLQELRATHADQTESIRQDRAEALGLERRLSNLDNQAYGLTPEEVALLWATAPPRTPLA